MRDSQPLRLHSHFDDFDWASPDPDTSHKTPDIRKQKRSLPNRAAFYTGAHCPIPAASEADSDLEVLDNQSSPPLSPKRTEGGQMVA